MTHGARLGCTPMAERKNKLQVRIGGTVGAMNAAELIGAARKALARLEPRVACAMAEHRDTLRRLAADAYPDPAALYGVAHDIRGLAGTFGYTHLGLVADALSRYLMACSETRAAPGADVVRVLAQAMDQAFVKDEDGGDLLAHLSESARALVTAKAPRAA